MAYQFSDLAQFLSAQTHQTDITPETALDADLRVYGDDHHDLIKAFAETFHVDMTGYLWYAHTGEEGINMGSLLFKPPNRRVKRIDITAQMLWDAANAGRWLLDYPTHVLPQRRFDIWFNWLICGGMVGVVVWILARHWNVF